MAILSGQDQMTGQKPTREQNDLGNEPQEQTLNKRNEPRENMNLEQEISLHRRPERFAPEHRRVITKFFVPGGPERIQHVLDRILATSEDEVDRKIDEVFREFEHRHRRFRRSLERHYQMISASIPPEIESTLSNSRKLLIGACFTHEYSVSAAAMFNPSMVPAPREMNDPDGVSRIIVSFRATGEGHISSIEFRSGEIDADGNITFDPISPYLEIPDISPDYEFNKDLFHRKLREIGANSASCSEVMNCLGNSFSLGELREAVERIRMEREGISFDEDLRTIYWLAESNYTVEFDPQVSISERVLFPVSENERQGIEDARFVQFTEDDDESYYVATYTAYNGVHILPQMIETRDFVTFKISTLNGDAVVNKGMALFPRRINGLFAMLGRQDGEKNYIMFSDNLHFWQEKELLNEPEYPWEYIQIGNNGSPIETEEGWLVITHGVGPMRKYCLGCLLLDLENPTRILKRSSKPILCPNTEERDGYVPNVVYSCGAMKLGNLLILPYAMSDSLSGFATLEIDRLIASMEPVD